MRYHTILILVIYFLVTNATVDAQSWERLLNLKGKWKFSIGDDQSRSKFDYNDKDWEEIRVPSSWEDEGFYGYNGYAWYRKHFTISASLKGRNFTLRLGRIDDVDEVYINGNLVGFSGVFPPDYQTAYSAWREYNLPEKYLNFNKENVISVRVYDAELQGGILEGDIGLFENVNAMRLDYDLSGNWKFKTGDNSNWKDQNYNDKNWNKIFVPGYWESQGYNDYDGFAWYRLTLTPPELMKSKKLVLVLGKIDDIDEVYLNGKLIGATGSMYGKNIEYNNADEWEQFRGYFIPEGLLIAGKENVIAVRVYDGFKDGGIYQGPIGLIEQSKYVKYWREHNPQKKKKGFWNLFFD